MLLRTQCLQFLCQGAHKLISELVNSHPAPAPCYVSWPGCSLTKAGSKMLRDTNPGVSMIHTWKHHLTFSPWAFKGGEKGTIDEGWLKDRKRYERKQYGRNWEAVDSKPIQHCLKIFQSEPQRGINMHWGRRNTLLSVHNVKWHAHEKYQLFHLFLFSMGCFSGHSLSSLLETC